MTFLFYCTLYCATLRYNDDNWTANNEYSSVLEIQKNTAVLNDIFVLLHPILHNPTI